LFAGRAKRSDSVSFGTIGIPALQRADCVERPHPRAQAPAELGFAGDEVVHGGFHAGIRARRHENLEAVVPTEPPDHVQEDLAHLAHHACVAGLGARAQ